MPGSDRPKPDANIVLTGFMGTGKTTIGREVARRLGRRFLDLDELIVQRAGKSVADIFTQDGEPAFRAMEAEVCQEMRSPAGLVVAAGGGAALDPANREALAAGGIVICLSADAETILTRLDGQTGRPLLDTPDRAERLKMLLAQRAGQYALLPNHLDTSRLPVAAAAERVMAIAARLPADGHRLVVRYGGTSGELSSSGYDILISPGLLDEAHRRLIEAGVTSGRCAIVTNSMIRSHYWPSLERALAGSGFEPILCEVPEGEAHKTLATASLLYGELAAARLARNESVVALGGGVIGDLAGFVAATWLRGVPFVQIPTSLLAMVDASVGGKVAVDLPQGKNLVGAFKQPALVMIDPRVLSTLPSSEYRAGLAEILKAGLIADPALFERLLASGAPAQADDLPALTGMIADAVRVKVEIVERDPFEMGDRAWLNLGHTFGHALELLSGFSLRHGEAVALGLIAAAYLSRDLGYCDASLPGLVQQGVERLGLPVRHAFDPSAALAAMGTDKKRRGRSLRFVVLHDVGAVSLVEDVPETAVRAALETIRA